MECVWKSVAGCALLRSFLAEDGSPTQRDLAKRLGTTEGTVYAWKCGFRRPGQAYREALWRIARISVDAWLTSAEKTRLKRLRAA